MGDAWAAGKAANRQLEAMLALSQKKGQQPAEWIADMMRFQLASLPWAERQAFVAEFKAGWDRLRGTFVSRKPKGRNLPNGGTAGSILVRPGGAWFGLMRSGLTWHGGLSSRRGPGRRMIEITNLTPAARGRWVQYRTTLAWPLIRSI
jgi:hypothetical protein